MAKLKDKVKAKITADNLIERGDHIILGLSGGPDSVCLFHILKCLEDELGFTLHAVHVNHNLRKDDSEKDQEYVEKLCKDSETKYWIFSEDCQKLAEQNAVSTEEAGRNLRYESFDRARNELASEDVSKDKIKIATAHNLEDQAETIIFRILRGTGIDGLAGMRSKGYGMFGLPIVRPLIDSPREEIEKYCSDENLNPRQDATNSKSMYQRNKIRLELLPELKKEFNPNIVNSIVRLSDVANEDKEYLWKVAEEEYEQIKTGELELDLGKLRKLEKPISHRIYETILRKMNVEIIERSHIKSIDDIVYSNSENPSLSVDLPDGVKAMKIYDKLVFVNGNDAIKTHNVECKVEEIDKESYDKMPKEGKIFAVFDADQIGNKKIVVRTRRDGDTINLKNLGTKKLQDFFVDNKLPKIYRDEIFVAACGREVLWILPDKHFKQEVLQIKGRMTCDYGIYNETKRVIFIEKTKQL